MSTTETPPPTSAYAAAMRERRETRLHYPHGTLRGTNVVAIGTVPAKVVLFGAAPGWEDEVTGAHFSGEAGQLLHRAIAASGISVPYYATNILPCRPAQEGCDPAGDQAGERPPSGGELEAFAPGFFDEVAAVSPVVAIALGQQAFDAVAPGNPPVAALRGRTLTYDHAGVTVPLLATFHPSAAARSGGYNTPEFNRIAEDVLRAFQFAAGHGGK